MRAANVENSLAVHVANKTLVEVMQGIAGDIGELKKSFPQLENWEEAEIFSDRIEYRNGGENGCHILIYSRGQPVMDEYKVGVYLKMKAVGKKAALLKKTLLDIVGRRFEKIRGLHHLS